MTSCRVERANLNIENVRPRRAAMGVCMNGCFHFLGTEETLVESANFYMTSVIRHTAAELPTSGSFNCMIILVDVVYGVVKLD